MSSMSLKMGPEDTECALKSILRIAVSFLLVLVSSAKGEIRCYCNQPTCVSTGYMCKSNSGACFTELFSYSADLSKSRHGCVELLKPEKRAQCRPRSAKVMNLPVVFCCHEDMCNYMNTVDINFHGKTNGTKVSGAYDLSEERRAYEAALQQDVWFKAAVIAVPIAGGFILVMLILLASRMLRQDSKRQRQLLELRRQQRLYSKPHLFVGHPCLDSSSSIASNSQSNCKYCRSAMNCKPSQSYGNTNLTMSTDSCYVSDVSASDRRYVYEKSFVDNSMCAALLPWTKWNHVSKSSTHV